MSGRLRSLLRRLLFCFGGFEPPSSERLNELRSQLVSEREIKRLIVEEGEIPAIRAFRAKTGASLLEAKTAVDEMVQEVE